MECPWKKWLALFGAMVLVQVFDSSSCFLEEKGALLDFKATYSNESLLPSWVDNPRSNCCRWERVKCDSSSGHVIHLSLESLGNGVIGGFCVVPTRLNWSLFLSFKELRSLNLSNNCLRWIHSEGRNKSALKGLETLDLNYNIVYESTMGFFSSLTSLKNLILAYNDIAGPFPPKELSLLRNLELLDLSFNLLSNPLTTQDFNALHKLKKLKTLNLAGNKLDKGIFRSLVALPALRSLFLYENYDIEGQLDDKVLTNLSKLEVLILSDLHLNGPFPIQGLCKMTQLQELDLKSNNFEGALDTCLGNLTSLRTLDLSNNFLNGSIPAHSIAHLASLEYLSLSHNKFEGLFSLNILANHSKLKVLQLGYMDSKTFQVEAENPHWIASSQLEHLEISYCQLNSPTKIIPTFLLYQNGLRYIDLSGNNLVGLFPNWMFVNNPQLEVVLLNDNSFTGPFKLPINPNHHMDRVRYLDLSNNQFQGELPNNIGFFLPHLEYFDISSNMFDGHIPASIGEMSSLTALNLAHNNFSGEVPKRILNGCISLDTLMMDNNQLNGTFLSWIGKLQRLFILTASRNNFDGAITKELCQLDLGILDLSHNKFSGAIPSCFNMPLAGFVYLQGNSLTGMIPEALINGSKMMAIDLSDNKFTGTIPESIYGLESLTFLILAGNQLQGQLSSQICQLQYLHILDLSHNNFTGSIPSCFNNISFGDARFNFSHRIVTYLDQSQLKYEDSMEEVQFITKGLSLSYKGGILQRMSGLDLSSNQLTGEIPHQIGDLCALHALNLSHNHLNGLIPESFQKLENIESLDLSNNNLSGHIPPQLQGLHFLSVFNVSYNNLSGRAPDKGQFATFGESNYKGNPCLSWNNSNRGVATLPPPLTSLNDGDSAIDFTYFYWSFGTAYVMILLVFVTILWINPHWRRAWLYFVEGCLHKCFGQFLEDAFY